MDGAPSGPRRSPPQEELKTAGDARDTPVTPSVARSSIGRVAERFGLGTPTCVQPVARGAMGEVLHLVSDSGRYAVKRLFWEVPTERDAREQVEFAERCALADVPSPRAVRTPDRDVLAEVDGQVWRVAQWADGQVPDRTDAEAARWLAGAAGRLHHRGEPLPGAVVDPWYLRADHDWAGLAERASLGAAPWASVLAARVTELAETSSWLEAVPEGEPVRCHRDLKAQNLLRDGQRWWLLDWDNVGPLAPWRELGILLVHHWREPETLSSLTGRYLSAGGPAYQRGAEVFASGVAQWLNVFAGQAQALLDPATARADRAFAEPLVLGLAEDLPTVGGLEAAATALA